ncbi:hypothetical protein [Tenacibaculum sp. IB213877]|uniref:hypothetical protein n=1 Tax=Tenacibaculum sp. IB213877 TaxID=3097351 RepID=UPI002A5AFFAD|nr:hypothetical protein [Tenacibaculum sp. IB213877]MDY0781598.1 hypothetical protein [Tenacibaculum sp. IB213877]
MNKKLQFYLPFFLLVFPLFLTSCYDDDIDYFHQEARLDTNIISFSNEVNGKLTFQDDAVVTLNNTNDEIGGLDNSTKKDVFEFKLIGSGDNATLSFVETEVDSKIFEATVSFKVGTDNSDDNTLYILPGEGFGISANNYSYTERRSDHAYYVYNYYFDNYVYNTWQMLVASTGTLEMTKDVKVGQEIAVRVSDADLNTDNSEAETIMVEVTSDLGEIETVTLTETGANTAIFEGVVTTVYGTSAGTNNDGNFTVSANTVLTASYTDAKNEQGEEAIITDTTTILGGVNGVVVVDETAKVGEDITITVTDVDLNMDITVAEIITVEVTSDKGETETVTLTETGVDTGVFTGTITTVYGANAGANNDASFNVSTNTVLTTSYTDVLNEQGAEVVINSTTTMLGGATGTILVEGTANVGDDLTVTVTDADLNTNNSVAETITVEVTSDKGEIETVTLTETGIDTGIFVGVIATVSGANAGVNNDDTLNAENNTVITATYQDMFDANGTMPSAVTSSITMIEVVTTPEFTFFTGKKLEYAKVITYNGSTTSSGVMDETDYTAEPYYCYGKDYELFKNSGDLEVYNNNSFDPEDPNHCNSGSSLTFTTDWSLNGDILSINNGIDYDDWTFEYISDTEFKISILQGGVQLLERYYQVVP